MLEKINFKLQYKLNGVKKEASGLDTEDYEVEIAETENTLKAILKPKKKIELINAYLLNDYVFGEKDRVFVSGYQSWTTTREYTRTDVVKGLTGYNIWFPLARKFTSMFGDYNFQKYPGKPGVFHSYSYTYINNGENIRLIGTMTERTGYTIFHYDMKKNKLNIQKDVEGVTIDSNYEIFNLYSTVGGYEEIFDAYFKALNIKPPKIDHLAGYTSWYNYYGTISEAQILRDLEGMDRVKDVAGIFQVDDGYQTAVGDWVCNEKFPNGLRPVVDKIHEKGLLAGLWMAPFNAIIKSKVKEEHPEWLIKVPGTNKNQWGVISWGGGYTLDICIEGAREHIKKCFDRVLNEWGFDLVKLDFLYSECQTPRYNKSRGQIMCEAVDFLRECVGDKLILGCGVPMFPTFGKFDACRIGSDEGLRMVEPWYVRQANNEIIGVRRALTNTIFRRHLNGRAFVNDPDVFYLREDNPSDPYYAKQGKIYLTRDQELLIADLNNLCGDVLFVSDNIGAYSDEDVELCKKFFTKNKRKVLDAQFVSLDDVEVIYENEGKKYKLAFNIVTGENKTIEI